MKRLKPILFLTLLMMSTIAIQAKNLGTLGKTYPIVEKNFIVFMKEKAALFFQSDQKSKLEKAMQREVQRKADRPTPAFHLTRTEHPKEYTVDPNIQWPQKGSINPFDQMTYSKMLVFIDGDDLSQMKWFDSFRKKALKEMFEHQSIRGYHLILTNGSIQTNQDYFKTRVFFDQGGKLAQYFHLEHVPVIIFEDKDFRKWRVREMTIPKGAC